MKKISILISVFIGLFFLSCSSKKEQIKIPANDYARILFYNVENLFDTLYTEGKSDAEFTPESDKKWNTERYNYKLAQLSKVIAAADTGYFPDIIALAEIENRQVVEDLMSTGLLADQGYKVIHKESPDQRGIDCALAYTSAFEPILNSYILIDLPFERSQTRDILYSKGILYSDTVHVFVNHWPSRYGGKEISDPKRAFTAQILRNTIDSIQLADKNPNIIIMGDFNDYPADSSLSQVLKAQKSLRTNPQELINLAWKSDEAGIGTYNYQGDWGTLDQFIVSANLFTNPSLEVHNNSYVIIKKDWTLYTNNKGEVYPARSYGGKNYYGGYSDHLAIMLKMKRNK
jgi:endonuclease/exonuclease/phosphatase family metal-dependent hydrolase